MPIDEHCHTMPPSMGRLCGARNHRASHRMSNLWVPRNVANSLTRPVRYSSVSQAACEPPVRSAMCARVRKPTPLGTTRGRPGLANTLGGGA